MCTWGALGPCQVGCSRCHSEMSLTQAFENTLKSWEDKQKCELPRPPSFSLHPEILSEEEATHMDQFGQAAGVLIHRWVPPASALCLGSVCRAGPGGPGLPAWLPLTSACSRSPLRDFPGFVCQDRSPNLPRKFCKPESPHGLHCVPESRYRVCSQTQGSCWAGGLVASAREALPTHPLAGSVPLSPSSCAYSFLAPQV